MQKQYRVFNPPDSKEMCEICAKTPEEAARMFFERRPDTRTILVQRGFGKEHVFTPGDLAERYPEVQMILAKKFPEILENEKDEFAKENPADVIRELFSTMLFRKRNKANTVLAITMLILSIPVALIYLAKWLINAD